MKKLLILPALLGFAITTIQAQLGKVQKPEKFPVKTLPSKTTPPSTTTPPPPATYVPVYTLTAVKVTLQTGNDNKDFGAALTLTLFQRNSNTGLYGLPGNGLTNELPVNSIMDFGLENNGYAPSVEKLKLETLQHTGLTLTIYYGPTFFLDAWKIEGVKLTLEFKDQNGNLHPVYGNKTIVFNTAKGILNNTFHWMRCHADGTFTPLTSPISEY
jgi:hypothetical protein